MNTEQMLEVILQKINSMDARMENVENKIDSMDARMGVIETRMESMENRMESMENRMDSMEDRVKLLEALPQQVKEIQLTLKSEVCREISIIAEAHLGLSRKLDEALAFQKEKERILLRVTSLEGDVQRIKSRIGMTM